VYSAQRVREKLDSPPIVFLLHTGAFDNVNGDMHQNFRKIAHWRGLSGAHAEWLPVYDGYAFSPTHQVFALAVDPTLRYI
jgi:hypothetical protein